MDLTQKYLVVLQRYECDLEFVRKLYQRENNNPSSAQFKTPVSSLLSDNKLLNSISYLNHFIKNANMPTT